MPDASTTAATGPIEGPISLGHALITLIEPRRGHEVAYNRWYEDDHFYAGCLTGAYTLAGGRFVATRAEKEKRYPVDTSVPPPGFGLDAGSYVALYWIQAGYEDAWNRWGVDQVNWLHANGRMFAERDHIHTLMYEKAAVFHGDGSGRRVSAELALDHHFAGLVIIIGELADGVDARSAIEWFRSRLGPAETTVAFTPIPLLGDAPGDVPRDVEGNRFTLVSFLDGDPIEVWDTVFAPLGAQFAAATLGKIVWASPFRSTVPGTDRFTDELW